MEDQHYTYRRQLDLIRNQIQKNFGGQFRLDLIKMLKTIEDTYTSMDKEFVQCRRKGKLTSTYEHKEEDLNVLINSLNKRITLALLAQN